MADQFIQIVGGDETTEWQYVHPETKQVYDSKFTLRVIEPKEQRRIRKQYTKFEFVRGQRQEVTDDVAFADACLDFAIVGWSGVRAKDMELPCTAEYKVMLPQMVKNEILRLCLGRELGQEQGAAEGHEQDEERGGAARPTPAAPTPNASTPFATG